MSNYPSYLKKMMILLTLSFFILTFDCIDVSAAAPMLTVHFMDVGEGDCILLTCGSDAVMVDFGVGGDGRQERLLEYIKSQGITKLKYAIGTHPHGDHMGALNYLIDNIPIRKIMLTRHESTEPFYLKTLKNIKRKKIPVKHPLPGSVFYCGKAKMKVLGPLRKKYTKDNDYSLVIKVTYGKISFMLTGDAEQVSERQLVKKYGSSLKSTVLKVGHHGHSHSSSKAFIKAVSPSYAVISVGPNVFGNPHKSVLKRLKNFKIRVKRTDQLGNIVVSTNGKKLFWKPTVKTKDLH